MWFQKAMIIGMLAVILRSSMKISSSHWGYAKQKIGKRGPLPISLSPKCNLGITSSGLLVLETVNVFYFEQLLVILLFAAKNILNDKLKSLFSRGQHNTSSCNSGTQSILENRFESLGQGIAMITQRCFPEGNCGKEFGSQQSCHCKS